jgi:hypothetical protein
MVTNNYIILNSGVNRNTQTQAGVMIWFRKSIENAIINYAYCSERIIDVKLNIEGRKLSFLDSTPQNKGEKKKRYIL